MTKQTVIAVALVLVTTLFSGVPQSTSAASAQEEELLKAAFVYNFAKYTSWPGRQHNGFSLCLTGEDKIFDALQRLHGQSVKGRDVTIRDIVVGEPATGGQDAHLIVSNADAHRHLAGPGDHDAIVSRPL